MECICAGRVNDVMKGERWDKMSLWRLQERVCLFVKVVSLGTKSN